MVGKRLKLKHAVLACSLLALAAGPTEAGAASLVGPVADTPARVIDSLSVTTQARSADAQSAGLEGGHLTGPNEQAQPVIRSAPETDDDGAALVQALRQGGYVLYIRHGEANVGQDQPELSLNNCATQRNLSEHGKEQARMLGEDFRRLGIPVQAPVMASPFCRTRESAAFAFGAENVTLSPVLGQLTLLGSDSASAALQRQALSGLNKLLETPPPAGVNSILVAHGFPDGTALGNIPYMGVVAVAPKGPGKGYAVAGRLTLEQLDKLARG